MKNRILACILVIVMLAACVGCSSQEQEDTSGEATGDAGETIRLGVSTQTFSISVYVMMEEAASALGKEKGVEVEWLSCDYDPTKQTSQVENFISQGYDAVCVEPVMPETGDTLIEMCEEAGIPVFTLETMAATKIPEVHIVADSVRVGEMQAEYFIEQWGTEEPANVVVLSATKGDHIAELITEGVLSVLEQHDNINIVMHQWCQNWDPAVAMSHMENAISANQGDIQAVFANNDQMANGALKAAINEGCAEDLWVIGADFDEETVVNIRDGYNMATLDKGAYLQGERIVEVALQLANGEEPTSDGMDGDTKCWFTPITMVDADNLEEMVETKFPDLAQ